MTQPPETIEVDPHTDTIGCDGGGGALGHPKVYYAFDGKQSVDCGYCGRRFVKTAAAEHAAAAEPAPAIEPVVEPVVDETAADPGEAAAL